MKRRIVRVAPTFFDALDEQLPEERTAEGTPSTADFLVHDIPTLIDRLAEDYEGVTQDVPSYPGVRVMIAAGRLVPYLAVYTILASDGAVLMIDLHIDNEWT